MPGDVQIPQNYPWTVVVSTKAPTTSRAPIGVPLVFQPQFYPALVVSFPSNDFVALKSKERSDSMRVGHLSSWSSRLSNDLVPRNEGCLSVFYDTTATGAMLLDVPLYSEKNRYISGVDAGGFAGPSAGGQPLHKSQH
jgi:hypothetical protein